MGDGREAEPPSCACSGVAGRVLEILGFAGKMYSWLLGFARRNDVTTAWGLSRLKINKLVAIWLVVLFEIPQSNTRLRWKSVQLDTRLR